MRCGAWTRLSDSIALWMTSCAGGVVSASPRTGYAAKLPWQETGMTTQERDYVRGLAEELRERAADPVMPERRRKWHALNNGQANEPLVVMKYHGVYEDVYPVPRCQNPLARSIEQ